MMITMIKMKETAPAGRGGFLFSRTTLVVAVLIFAVSAKAGERLEDRTTVPTHTLSEVEKVASFKFPPGHITISRKGRVFIDSYIADESAPQLVTEIKKGKKVPFPSTKYQKQFRSIHGIYVDSKDRLWILDHGIYGFKGAPRLYGYDINTGKEIENYSFPHSVAGLGSMLNDVIFDPVRNKLYISETGPISHKSAIIVFDIASHTARRVLSEHPSLSAGPYDIFVEGVPFTVLGFRPKYGIDGIALDPANQWFYYSAFNLGELYRIPADALADDGRDDEQLAEQIEKVADTTMTDGMLFDSKNRIYLSDVEHSAILRVHPSGALETVFKNPIFRWPTGFTKAPDGTFYFTCNAIHLTQLKSRKEILAQGPYHLFRFKP